MRDELNDRFLLSECEIFCVPDSMFVVEFVCNLLTPSEMLRISRRVRSLRCRLGKRGNASH